MNYSVTLTIAAGIILALLYEAKTGWSCGGLVTPGAAALALRDPERILCAAAISIGVALLLRLSENCVSLYGKRRTGVAMLLALASRAALGQLSPDPLWLGWVVPGLVASEMNRQGMAETLISAAIVTAATAAASELIFYGLRGAGLL